MARRLFRTVVINDKRVEKVIPQPDFAVFFRCVLERPVGFGGSDGLSFGDNLTVQHVLSVSIPRKRPSRRLLSDDQVEYIKRATGKTVRQLAIELGVSHATVHTARRLDDDR